jgi:hypothetical protein
VDLKKISEEEWLSIEREMTIQAYQVAIMALVDMGDSEGALNFLRPHMRMSGNAFAINMLRLFDIQGNDLEPSRWHKGGRFWPKLREANRVA